MRALLGASDRTGLVDFAAGLAACGIEIIATDGTRRALAEAGVEALAVADVTGAPEMLDGRVKTLHPAIHAGILARRDLADHLSQLEERGFAPIDIVAVSLYPFEQAVERGAPEADVIENIDIGGPALIRAAAKNSDAVTVIVSPDGYGTVLEELAAGGITAATRRRLAAEAFAHVAAYDSAVAGYLARRSPGEGMPSSFTTGGARLHPLRYGENPHQHGALYRVPGGGRGVAGALLVQGAELSFTNWLDIDSAWAIVSDFTEPAAVIVKHTNPCGFAVGEDLATAYARAHECDPRSAYGGIVAVNRPLDEATAELLMATFLEAAVAPSTAGRTRERLASKPRLRLLEAGAPGPRAGPDVRSISGGLLVQSADRVAVERDAMRLSTAREPTEAEWRELLLAWRLCRHVKSNAIVVMREGGMAVGVGAGQMSRVEAAELAVARAGDRSAGAVAASDAFFPMPDGLEVLGRAGITAVIQPGGSRRDPEVTAAADALGMAMVMAGERHFRH